MGQGRLIGFREGEEDHVSVWVWRILREGITKDARDSRPRRAEMGVVVARCKSCRKCGLWLRARLVGAPTELKVLSAMHME